LLADQVHDQIVDPTLRQTAAESINDVIIYIGEVGTSHAVPATGMPAEFATRF
jgi:hypothetical protein